MVRAECPDGDVWTYAYDPFGRRVSKVCKHTKVTFIWDGDVIAREITETRDRVDVVDWFFEPGSFRPMARLEAGDLTHVINDHLGTPKEVVGGDGSLRWSADHDTWGTLRTRRETAAAQVQTDDYWVEPTAIEGNTAKAYAPNPDALYCPIRFQGQWEDGETGLYYNRFRYFCPLTVLYLSSDPLAIGGGSRPYHYVSLPTTKFDPLGLEEVFYRFIPSGQVNQLITGGGLLGTGETTLATDLGYYDASGTSYNGCLMRITTSDGTFDELARNGIAADASAADMVQARSCCRPNVPASSRGWNRNNVARFKSEEGFLNMQLGRSGALDTFNSRIQGATPLRGDCP